MRQAAQERLLLMVEPSLDVLYRATRQAPPCPHCGRSDADRDPVAVRAAGMILDRTGFGPQVQFELTAANPFDNMSLDEMATWAEAVARRLRADADAEAARELPPALEAEIVEPDRLG